MSDETLVKIANMVHHGGLLGYNDTATLLTDLRMLTLPYWDKEECDKLQAEQHPAPRMFLS